MRPNVGVVNTRTHQRLITFSTASLEPSIRGGLACKLFRAIFLFFFPLVRRGGIINNEDYVCSMLDARVKIIRRIIVLLSSILISVVKSMTVSCKNLKNRSKLRVIEVELIKSINFNFASQRTDIESIETSYHQ